MLNEQNTATEEHGPARKIAVQEAAKQDVQISNSYIALYLETSVLYSN